MPEVSYRLRALAADTPWPATPDLAAAVTAAIESSPRAAPGRPPRLARSRLPAPALAAALLAIVLAAGLVAAPGVRSELLERLGLKHATVTRVKRLPPTTLDTRLGLGVRVSPARARDAAGFELRRPAALGAPDAVYSDRGAVTFTYGVTRPVLFTQVRGTARPFVSKLVTRTSERVDISGASGLVIEGDHVVIFKPSRGAIRDSPSRLAATTVLWERDGLLLRLEGERPPSELVRIARSVG